MCGKALPDRPALFPGSSARLCLARQGSVASPNKEGVNPESQRLSAHRAAKPQESCPRLVSGVSCFLNWNVTRPTKVIMRVLPCALLMTALLFPGQREKEKWERVYTGEDSIIEIDSSRVTFVEDNASTKVTFGYSVGRVNLRTIYKQPEALKETPGVKYKTRFETIEFNCPAKRYRLYEATLRDEKGKVIKTMARDPSAEWKVIRPGGMMDKLSVAACKLIDEKRRNP